LGALLLRGGKGRRGRGEGKGKEGKGRGGEGRGGRGLSLPKVNFLVTSLHVTCVPRVPNPM